MKYAVAIIELLLLLLLVPALCESVHVNELSYEDVDGNSMCLLANEIEITKSS